MKINWKEVSKSQAYKFFKDLYKEARDINPKLSYSVSQKKEADKHFALIISVAKRLSAKDGTTFQEALNELYVFAEPKIGRYCRLSGASDLAKRYKAPTKIYTNSVRSARRDNRWHRKGSKDHRVVVLRTIKGAQAARSQKEKKRWTSEMKLKQRRRKGL